MTQPPSSAEAAPPALCAWCGAPVPGRFCSHCGAPAAAGNCPACRSSLSPGARFCHRCGAPSRALAEGRSRERTGWIFAGIGVLVAALAILWRAGSFRQAAAPEMANPGNAGAGARLGGPAPDISGMSPEERFERLFERVFTAGERGDTLTVRQFAPMALGAYAQLETVNADLRFHAALIDLALGDFSSADALADSILAQSPGHLFAYLIRAESAERQNRTQSLAQSYREFLAHYDTEMRAGRGEYAEHRPILDDFRTRAKARLNHNQ